jgi:di/tripeptidase
MDRVDADGAHVDAGVDECGDRPGGHTPADATIVEAAVRSNTAFGQKTALISGSTDANVPMSLGIPAIVIGGGGKIGCCRAAG